METTAKREGPAETAELLDLESRQFPAATGPTEALAGRPVPALRVAMVKGELFTSVRGLQHSSTSGSSAMEPPAGTAVTGKKEAPAVMAAVAETGMPCPPE